MFAFLIVLFKVFGRCLYLLLFVIVYLRQSWLGIGRFLNDNGDIKIILVVPGLNEILDGYFGLFRHERFYIILDSKRYKSIKDVGNENLLFESYQFVMPLIFFS